MQSDVRIILSLIEGLSVYVCSRLSIIVIISH